MLIQPVLIPSLRWKGIRGAREAEIDVETCKTSERRQHIWAAAKMVVVVAAVVVVVV